MNDDDVDDYLRGSLENECDNSCRECDVHHHIEHKSSPFQGRILQKEKIPITSP